jgi:aspartate-semialdehyde dehydrogenase
MMKRKVAILGATGLVGQRFVQLLDDHPWFSVSALTGSDRSIGHTYYESCKWHLPSQMPEWACNIPVQASQSGLDADIVFSALPADIASSVEVQLASDGYHVFSNASVHRMSSDVPLLIPEVNSDHADLVLVQRNRRGWKGSIVTNSNCTATGVTLSLKPLFDNFGLKRVFLTSMQALSGAGYPGMAALDMIDNIVPFIDGEEQKMQSEPLKMLGCFDGNQVIEADFGISAQCNRVPVSDGHIVCVKVELGQAASVDQVSKSFSKFVPNEIVRGLPSSPGDFIKLFSEQDRPQPRLDRQSGGGMTTMVGRVIADSMLHIRYVVLSHNTVKGAAGGSLQNAELLLKKGLI